MAPERGGSRTARNDKIAGETTVDGRQSEHSTGRIGQADLWFHA
jgi:hypothetical protein